MAWGLGNNRLLQFVTHVRNRLQTICFHIPYNPGNGLDFSGAAMGRKTRLPGVAIQEGGGLF